MKYTVVLILIIVVGCGDKTNKDNVSIYEAIRNSDINKLTLLLSNNNIDINAKDNAGFAPLHHAVLLDNEKATQVLLKKRANVNVKDSKWNTPLHGASHMNNLRLVELLCKNGADINAKNVDGTTPLHWAVIGPSFGMILNKKKVIKRLIAYGADVNSQDNDGESPLDFVTYIDNKEAESVLRDILVGHAVIKKREQER